MVLRQTGTYLKQLLQQKNSFRIFTNHLALELLLFFFCNVFFSCGKQLLAYSHVLIFIPDGVKAEYTDHLQRVPCINYSGAVV